MKSLALRLAELGDEFRKLGFVFRIQEQDWLNADGVRIEWQGRLIFRVVSASGEDSVIIRPKRGSDEEQHDDVVVKLARAMEKLRCGS